MIKRVLYLCVISFNLIPRKQRLSEYTVFRRLMAQLSSLGKAVGCTGQLTMMASELQLPTTTAPTRFRELPP